MPTTTVMVTKPVTVPVEVEHRFAPGDRIFEVAYPEYDDEVVWKVEHCGLFNSEYLYYVFGDDEYSYRRGTDYVDKRHAKSARTS
jgi:hypothetical protein